MFNQRFDPPSWAIELPGSGTPAERPTAQIGVPRASVKQSSSMRPPDQRPILLTPTPPGLEVDSRPLSAPVTGPETPRWQYTILPVTSHDRTEDARPQQDIQSTFNSRSNLVRMHGHLQESAQCILMIPRVIVTRSQTQIQYA
jgi:hypothetical protein